MRTDTELYAVNVFNKNFNTDLDSKVTKLREETSEFFSAYEEYKKDPSPENLAHLQDEVSDVQGVLAHVLVCLAMDINEALLNCVVKIKVREHVPNYLKSEEEKP